MNTELISAMFLFLGIIGIVVALIGIVFKYKSGYCVLMFLFFGLLSYDMFVIRYVQNGIYALFPGLLFTNWALPFVYGPMLYLVYFIRYRSMEKIKLVVFLYFVPFVMIFLINIPTVFQSASNKIEVYNEFRSLNLPYVFHDLEWFGQLVFNISFYFLTWFTFKNVIKSRVEKISVFTLAAISLAYGIMALVLDFGSSVFDYYNIFVTIEWIIVLLLGVNNYRFYKKENK